MEEITARFEIVRLSVKLADHDAIAVQIKKLRDISLDEHLNEIITLLETKNYRQSLYLMKGYVASLEDNFFDKKTPASSKKQKTKESAKEVQSLFDMTQPRVDKTINLDDMLRMTKVGIEDTVEYQEVESDLEEYIAEVKSEIAPKIHNQDTSKTKVHHPKVEESVEEIAKKPISKDIPAQERVGMLGSGITKESVMANDTPVSVVYKDIDLDPIVNKEAVMQGKEIDADKLYDQRGLLAENESIKEVSKSIDETIKPDFEEPMQDRDYSQVYEDIEGDMSKQAEEETLEKEDTYHEKIQEETQKHLEQETQKDRTLEEELPKESTEEIVEEVESTKKPMSTEDNRRYSPISYIDQKFRNMRHQFPQVEEFEDGIIDDVTLMLRQIATKGYTEQDVTSMIDEYDRYKQAGDKAEAAQILLLAAATESKYAQHLLARELFRGEVLKIDYPESFTQINRLAEHDYPEAICDLAQLYEYGYGIKKDKKTAILLYEEAAEMGIERAQKHFDRLSHKKGMFGSLFK